MAMIDNIQRWSTTIPTLGIHVLVQSFPLESELDPMTCI